MKIKWLCLLLALFGAIGWASSQNQPKPAVSAAPIGADSLAIYRDFLRNYNNGSKSPLNISEFTEPFQPDDSDRKGCLRPFRAADFGSTVVHQFASDSFPPPNKLVDPNKHKIADPGTAIRNGQAVDDAVEQGFAAGLFSFSEIVFDASHTHAALSFSFHCGMLCGHGSTLVYQKQNGVWKQAKSSCARWIS